MIITRYIEKKVLLTQVSLFWGFLFVLLLQKSVAILTTAADGNLPPQLILQMILLSIPLVGQLLLPLSLFLGILLAFSRLYMQGELTAMQACGLTAIQLLRIGHKVALYSLLLATFNNFFIVPYAARYQQELLAHSTQNPQQFTPAPGRFHWFKGNQCVIFINGTNAAGFGGIFLAQANKNNPSNFSLFFAKSAKIEREMNGSLKLSLHSGSNYLIDVATSDYQTIEFDHASAYLEWGSPRRLQRSANALTFKQLLSLDTVEKKTELYWRISLIFSTILLVAVAVPLSKAHPRQGKMVALIPGVVFFLIYFLLQSSIRLSAEQNNLSPGFEFSLLNLVVLAIATILNTQHTLIHNVKRRYRSS